MYRASTPTHKYKLPFSRELIENFLLTYSDVDTGEQILVKTIEDAEFIDDHNIKVTLTQEETNLFNEGTAKAQFRVKTRNKKVIPSKDIYIRVYDVSNDEVI